jgi:NAD(P)-dependent dehydrogenase (short-subunit alcohol dehydrogenase family)
VATIPLGRGSTPADVANACTYLASEEAAFITGVNIEVRRAYFKAKTLIDWLGGWWSLCIIVEAMDVVRTGSSIV